MDDIAARAARVSSRHPSPVLSFEELGRLVRGSGVSVTDDILLHSLTREAGRFRVIDPWRGPWSALVRPDARDVRRRHGPMGGPGRAPGSGEGPGLAPGSGKGRRRVSRERGDRQGDIADAPLAPRGFDDLPRGPWVVAEPAPAPWSPGGHHLAVRRLREALLHLAWTLDERSPRDVARWCSLVGEGGRVRRRLTMGEAA